MNPATHKRSKFLLINVPVSGITPNYELVQIEGAVHEPSFRYRVSFGDKDGEHTPNRNLYEIHVVQHFQLWELAVVRRKLNTQQQGDLPNLDHINEDPFASRHPHTAANIQILDKPISYYKPLSFLEL